MARFNEILVGRYNRFLQKFLSMKGGPPAPQLASELSAVFPLFYGRENRYLEDWKIYGARVGVPAVAAQDDVIRLNNPKNSNIIAVVESILVTVESNASEAIAEYSNVDSGSFAAVVTPANFDNRSNPPGNGSNGAACIASGANNVGQGTHFIFADLVQPTNITSPDLILHEDQEIPLLPNSDLQVRSITLNTNMIVAFRWRERALEESERF